MVEFWTKDMAMVELRERIDRLIRPTEPAPTNRLRDKAGHPVTMAFDSFDGDKT